MRSIVEVSAELEALVAEFSNNASTYGKESLAAGQPIAAVAVELPYLLYRLADSMRSVTSSAYAAAEDAYIAKGHSRDGREMNQMDLLTVVYEHLVLELRRYAEEVKTHPELSLNNP